MGRMTCCDLDDFLAAMSDETRQRILALVREREMSVSELVKHFVVTQPTISHHLVILRRARLVSTHREGREIFYRANPDCVIECCRETLCETRFHFPVAAEVSKRGKR